MTQPTTSANSRETTASEDPAALMRDMLIGQARTLNAMFTELVENAASTRPYLITTSTYTRLALRAQANCRAALQAVERTDRAGRQAGEK